MDIYIVHTQCGVLFCSSIYIHIRMEQRRECGLSLSPSLYLHTSTQQQAPIFRCIAFHFDSWTASSSILSVLLSKHFSPEWTHTFHLTLGSRVLLLLSDLFSFVYTIFQFMTFYSFERLYHSNYADGGFFPFLSSDSVFTTIFSLLCFDVGWQPSSTSPLYRPSKVSL